jgi:hypothetical protein
MDPFWQELIKYLGSAVVLTGALAWLARSLTAHFLSRDLEAHKERLAAVSKQELARLNTQLRMVAKEHEIRFGKLHEKRAEAIIEVYLLLEKINGLRLLVKLLLENKRPIDESIDEAVKAYTKLDEFFRKNRLYFSAELAELMHALIVKMVDPLRAYLIERDYAILNDLELGKELRQRLTESLAGDSTELFRAIESVAREFRLLLGSEARATESLDSSPPQRKGGVASGA